MINIQAKVASERHGLHWRSHLVTLYNFHLIGVCQHLLVFCWLCFSHNGIFYTEIARIFRLSGV